MKKKILIIGNSVKEFALAKKMSEKYEIFVAPGTDMFKDFATCLDIREDSVAELLDFVMENDIDLTIPISDKVLKTNIVDLFNNNAQQIFAPKTSGLKYVFDKALAKKMFYKLRIPTPKFGIFEKQNMAADYIKNQKLPAVIKTNESSSAVVVNSQTTAKLIVDSMFANGTDKVIIEDYVWGTPFSFYAITDGYKALPFGSSIIYKHSLDGDGGQLTSGMGACSPNYKLSFDNEDFLMNEVVYPILEMYERENEAYLGILGISGIISDDGQIQVLGLQPFLQDCDSTSVLEILEEDLYSLFTTCVIGSFSDEVDEIKTNNFSSVSIGLACKKRSEKENVIKGLDNLDEETLVAFYPTVSKNRYLELEANVGLNLVLTTKARSLASAVEKAYDELAEIDYNGLAYRKDICKSFK